MNPPSSFPWSFNILVGVVPMKGDEVLLTQRSEREKFLPGAWGLPSGKIEFGETLEEAVAREVLEETGLAAHNPRLIGHSLFLSEKGNTRLHNLQLNFIVDVHGDQPIILDHSSQDWQWIALGPSQLPVIDEFTRKVLIQAVNALG